MLESSGTEVLPASRLFEDNNVLVAEPSYYGKNGVEGDVLMKEEDIDSALRDEPLPLSSASPDETASASPSTGDGSRVSTTPPAGSKPRGKAVKKEPQLIGSLPRAEEAAMRTFTEIGENAYQYGTLGRSREALESMTCDCQYEHGQ